MSEPTEPTPETPPAPARYDILAVSQNRAYNVVEQGLKSLINFMQASGFVRVNDEAVAEEWVEVYGAAGPTAHEMFVQGPYTSDVPVVLEIAFRSGTRPCRVPYGPADPDESCYFWIEIRGALFNDITGKTKLKLRDVMATRFDFFVRPHQALPPHLVVPPDEAPIDKKKKKDTPAHRVGTAVEEF